MNNSGIVRIGMIGLGPRAETLLATLFLMKAEVTAICDLSTEKCDRNLSLLTQKIKTFGITRVIANFYLKRRLIGIGEYLLEYTSSHCVDAMCAGICWH